MPFACSAFDVFRSTHSLAFSRLMKGGDHGCHADCRMSRRGLAEVTGLPTCAVADQARRCIQPATTRQERCIPNRTLQRPEAGPAAVAEERLEVGIRGGRERRQRARLAVVVNSEERWQRGKHFPSHELDNQIHIVRVSKQDRLRAMAQDSECPCHNSAP